MRPVCNDNMIGLSSWAGHILCPVTVADMKRAGESGALMLCIRFIGDNSYLKR